MHVVTDYSHLGHLIYFCGHNQWKFDTNFVVDIEFLVSTKNKTLIREISLKRSSFAVRNCEIGLADRCPSRLWCIFRFPIYNHDNIWWHKEVTRSKIKWNEKSTKLLNKPHDVPKNCLIYVTILPYKGLGSSPLIK